ncbi:hypothetical protein [Gordonia sp. (in: high G+C Gram-positive bacteria)]|uniref:hypothetical protein n=1 Tax=Gordonia sp. (in: high G+C Gram-positive bacteria) TaxID=84139 RepID=UPI0016B9EFAF|nr:hypothetical protein [Gordonia sp. (in: high G+C Gram-positive bacteria)]NLG47829.1 hypothetical protein [Gordonia sp. (in: high G+C Gram-positive bacteria)]
MSYQHYSDPNYPPMGGQPPRKPSPWSSPVVLLAIFAGIIVLVGGVVAAVVYSGGDDPENVASSSDPSGPPPAVTHTETVSPTTHTVTETPAQVPTTQAPQTGPIGVAGADRQGFSNLRCNAPEDPAVFIGYTERSRVVICQVGSTVGRNYYKGLAGGNTIEVGYPARSGDSFVATNGNVDYVVTRSALTIRENGSVIKVEPMIQSWVD